MSFSGARQTMDKERVSFNLARLKKGGDIFEVAVDPDLAIDHVNGKDIDIKDVVRSEKVFSDVKKGIFAPENRMEELFGTTDPLQIAEIILKEGEIQFTEEYREKLREDKRKKIISMITRNSVDPKTKLPHPGQRIENAMAEAKVRIDMFKPAESQVEDIVKKLRPILPISFEKKRIHLKFPAAHAGKAYGIISGFAKPEKEEWKNDGSYECEIEIPAGMEPDFYDKINNATSGEVETKVIE
ncbi:ribosome assembly factor SBDS [Candidatus Woesearchaeota archaeon]|nr:ribosome assembly factor SBDS [Candidatus Woesearchaeota archaeon]